MEVAGIKPGPHPQHGGEMTIKRYPHGSFGTPGAEHPQGSFVLFSDYEHALTEKDQQISDLRFLLENKQAIADSWKTKCAEQSRELEWLRGSYKTASNWHDEATQEIVQLNEKYNDLLRLAVEFAEWYKHSFDERFSIQDLKKSPRYQAVVTFLATPAAMAVQGKGDEPEDIWNAVDGSELDDKS